MRDVAVSDWPVRIPLTVISQVSASTNIRVNVGIKATCAPFWDNVDSNGHRIFIGSGDGASATWERTSWDYANKSAVLRVDYQTNAGSTNADNCVLYLFVGQDSGADLAGSPTHTTAKDGEVQVADDFPVVLAPDSLIITDETTPTIDVGGEAFALTTSEERPAVVPIWHRLTRWTGDTQINGSGESETPQWFRVEVFDSSSSALGAWTDMNSCRLVFLPGQGFAVVAHLTPNSEEDARLQVTVGTSEGRTYILNHRITADAPTIT